MSQTLLVTGASGKLGRAVIRHLIETQKVPAQDIIATTRKPEELSDLAAKGIVVRKADFDDEASLAEAFKGADRILIISTDAVGVPGKRIAQHRNAVAAAKKAGVKHILYTSMPNPDVSEVLFAPDHAGTEKAIKESGIPYTILRASWYQENLVGSLANVIKSGTWYTSSGSGKLAHVSRDDIAAAAAGALVASGSESGTYTLTGTVARSYAEIAEIASKVTGKPIKVVQVTDEAFAESLRDAGLPAPVADLVTSIERNCREGYIKDVTDDVEKFAGHKPGSLESFLEANKAALLGA